MISLGQRFILNTDIITAERHQPIGICQSRILSIRDNLALIIHPCGWELSNNGGNWWSNTFNDLINIQDYIGARVWWINKKELDSYINGNSI